MFNRVSSQDVSASYASIGIVRVTVTAARQVAAPPAAPTETVAAGDSVSLSPQALAAAQQPEATTAVTGPAPIVPTDGGVSAPAAASPTPSPTGSGVNGLAAALIEVLDADGDGSLSKDEFVEGAKALLGRARARRRGGDEGESADEVGKHDRGHHVGRGHRLERRLEKAFGRIDADDNGSLDAGELAAALARASRRTPEPLAPVTEPTPAPAPLPAAQTASSAPIAVPPVTEPTSPVAPEQQTPAPAQAGATAPAQSGPASASTASLFSLSVTTVTFVSVAVQKYQAVNELKA